MKVLIKSLFCLCLILAFSLNSYAQTSCCAKGNKTEIACKPNAKDKKACCSNAIKKETTSGCTPSNCRGAQTKFGEAKVISDLRQQLISLKSKMEEHKKYNFSAEAISIHDIIGETDAQSLDIIYQHLILIQSEIVEVFKSEVPALTLSNQKALKVQQLNQQIALLSAIL